MYMMTNNFLYVIFIHLLITVSLVLLHYVGNVLLITQLEWKEEIMQQFSSVQKDRATYPKLEDDLLRRRRQELQ